MWFIGVEVEQETSAPPPKKNLDPPLSNRVALTEKTLEFWIVGRLWEVGEHGGSTKDSSGYKFPGFIMFI